MKRRNVLGERPVPREYATRRIVNVSAHKRRMFEKTRRQINDDFIDAAAYRIASMDTQNGPLAQSTIRKIGELIQFMQDVYGERIDEVRR